MQIRIAIHDPQAGDMTLVTSGPNDVTNEVVPVGIRFGDAGSPVIYFSSAHDRREEHFINTIVSCDQMIEYLQTIRASALKRAGALRPDEVIVAVVSDANGS